MISKSKYDEYAVMAKHAAIQSEDLFEQVLENVFAFLSKKQEVHNIDYCTSTESSKQFYNFLLIITTDFVRNDVSSEEIEEFLLNSCGMASSRVKKYLDHYKKNRLYLQFSLLNVGSYLPHVTDVRWKMDYIVKSSMMEDSEGPLYRISLITEQFDSFEKCNKIKNINFTCNSLELQDLVNKLKDAVRHSNTIINKINQHN